MDEKNLIWRVTETNVDGCGGTATEFVRFDTDITADADRCRAFQDCLSTARNVAALDPAGDFDTAEMIQDALDLFGKKTGVKGSLCPAPYAGGFEF